MAHGMLLDPPGKTVHVWNVTVRSAVLRKHTEHSEEIVLHLCVYIFFTVFFGSLQVSYPYIRR